MKPAGLSHGKPAASSQREGAISFFPKFLACRKILLLLDLFFFKNAKSELEIFYFKKL